MGREWAICHWRRDNSAASSVFGKVSSQGAGRRGFERRPIPLMPPVAARSWAVLVRIFFRGG